MTATSRIEWTEQTWNPTVGCTKISQGCKHCYAEAMAHRLQAMGTPGYEKGFELVVLPQRLDDPLKRKKPTTYFVNSMSDLFHDLVPDEHIDSVFRVIQQTPHHTYQILTKRAARMARYFRTRPAPTNAWLGVPASRFGSDIELLKGTFQNRANGIIADIQRRAGGERAIFLLDQYAYDQVTGLMLKSIFSQVKGAEIILTFAVDSLISFLADNEASRAKLAQMGMDAHIDWIALEALRSAPPATWRAAIQRNLSKGLIEASGAKNFTIFYITPMGNTSWTYWLIHLSNTAKARDVMMELHWQSANHFSHYLEPDIFTLGYQANLDSNATMQDALELGESHQFDTSPMATQTAPLMASQTAPPRPP
jgi:three-Cys-motif partner protein